MEKWTKIGIVENRFEADRVSQALNESGIPFIIKSFLDTAYDGLYIPQKGWAAVFVPADYSIEAENIISEIKIGFSEEREDKKG
jgi:hypothetical protein